MRLTERRYFYGVTLVIVVLAPPAPAILFVDEIVLDWVMGVRNAKPLTAADAVGTPVIAVVTLEDVVATLLTKLRTLLTSCSAELATKRMSPLRI